MTSLSGQTKYLPLRLPDEGNLECLISTLKKKRRNRHSVVGIATRTFL
jgi:hypothetical protein